jgi:hypothetical protein
MPTDMPTVNVNAGNEDPPTTKRPSTGIDVIGSNFPPGTEVNIEVDVRRTRSTALVQADGSFDFSFNVRPPLGCGATVTAVVTGSGGIRVEGAGDVFCP